MMTRKRILSLLIGILALARTGLPLPPGDHYRVLQFEGRNRSYLFHLPPNDDPRRPMPVVLILHGATMNASMMPEVTGMNEKADEAGFIAAYPNARPSFGFIRRWRGVGQGSAADGEPDEVMFISRVLDDLAQVTPVDLRRIYATGYSNGGMMCYRLAAELPDRIAAVASVSGTMDAPPGTALRPVPVMHFHGTDDYYVPYDGRRLSTPDFVHYAPVEATIAEWVKHNSCATQPRITREPDKADDHARVTKIAYQGGADVILYRIEGGGHGWPGRKSQLSIVTRTTFDISANDLMWDFFRRHPLRQASEPGGRVEGETDIGSQ